MELECMNELEFTNIKITETPSEKYHYLYKIVNSLDGKIYFGITYSPNTRWDSHKKASKDLNQRTKLYNAIRTHGIENFRIYLLYRSRDRTLIENSEIQHISEHCTMITGYNIQSGGNGGEPFTKSSISTRQKLSDLWTPEDRARKGIENAEFYAIPENKELRSQQIRNGWTDEVRQKQSKICKGNWTAEVRENKSKEVKEFYSNEDNKKIQSERLTAAWTDDMKANVSKAKTEFFASDIGKETIRLSNIPRSKSLNAYYESEEWQIKKLERGRKISETKQRKKLERLLDPT